MDEGIVAADGRLTEVYRPAVYFDSSVLIDYWTTEGAEVPDKSEWTPHKPRYLPVLRELVQTERRYSGMVAVRKALLFEQLDVTAVTTPLAQLELIEWHAEAVVKNLAADAVGTLAIQKKSKKEIGELLRKIAEGRRREALEKAADRCSGSTGLELLLSETWVEPGFACLHGLRGVLVADVQNFAFRVHEAWDVAQLLAYLQVGMADIIHLLVAAHLGCSWFASFDSDFERCREHLRDGLGLTLVRTPEEILTTLKQKRGSGDLA